MDRSARTHRNRAITFAFAALLAAAVLVPYAIALVRIASGSSAWLGFRPDYDGVIHVVAPNSPAALAGIAPGDRFDLAATPIDMRRFAVAELGPLLAPGTPIVLAVRHAGKVRSVTLQAAVRPGPPGLGVFIEVAQWFGEFAGIAIAFVILARRPGFLAAMLYLYALSIPAATDQVAFGGLPLGAYLALTLGISDLIGGFGPAALLLFALRFPDDHVAAEAPQRLGAAAGPALVHFMLRRSQRNERRLSEQLRDAGTALTTLRADVAWLRGCLESATVLDGRMPSGVDE